jgi:hypothetical protein
MIIQNDPPPLTAPVLERAAWWKERGDVGISGLTIWHVFAGGEPPSADHPYDVADFRRCHQLLSLIPEWRADLGRVAMVYPWFKPFTDNWEVMESLYAEGARDRSCPGTLYALMRDLTREAAMIKR